MEAGAATLLGSRASREGRGENHHPSAQARRPHAAPMAAAPPWQPRLNPERQTPHAAHSIESRQLRSLTAPQPGIGRP